MSPGPKFHDASLTVAVTESAAELESFQKQLTEATADTKELEIWLQATGFCIDVYIDVKADIYSEIGWDQIDGKWRLVGKYWDDDERDYSRKALSDSSARSRLACRQHLPALVKAITNQFTEIQNAGGLDNADFC